MNVSPLDLRHQRFRTAFRGFDPVEVTAFLSAVADDYEEALRETDRLRQQLAHSEAMVNEHREHERNLRNTLLTAQRLSDEIKVRADEDAARILRDAEARAELLVQKAHLRVDDLQREIEGLALKRRDVETSLESTIQTLRNTLESVREGRQRSDEKILVHRPRQAAEPVAPPADATAAASAPIAVSR